MGWVVLSILAIALSVLFVKISVEQKSEWISIFAVSVGMLALCVLAVAVLTIPQNTAETMAFQQQKSYIEYYTPENEIENAALTAKKIELNSWLYKAQFLKKSFGMFSLYPQVVLELEEIQ